MSSEYILENNRKVFIHGVLPSEKYAAAGNERFLLLRENFEIKRKIDGFRSKKKKMMVHKLKLRINGNQKRIKRLEAVMRKALDQEKVRYRDTREGS